MGRFIHLVFFLFALLETQGQSYMNLPGVPINSVIAPEYPGGEEGLLKDLQRLVKYPVSALEDEVQGTVYVNFYILKNGKVRNITVQKGVRDDLDTEAVRVVRRLKKWKPATQYGNPVTISFGLPVRFMLLEPGQDKPKPTNNDVLN